MHSPRGEQERGCDETCAERGESEPRERGRAGVTQGAGVEEGGDERVGGEQRPGALANARDQRLLVGERVPPASYAICSR